MDEKDLIEPRQPDEENFIFGKNQNTYRHINPESVYPIDESGFKIPKKNPTEEEIVAHYWRKKTKSIAVLGAISALIPFSILTQESGVFDMFFGKITEGIAWAFGTLIGMVL